jgi:hypothetical protein
MRPRRVATPTIDGSAFVGYRFPAEVIVLAVRWYLRYWRSYRDLERLLTGENGRDGTVRLGRNVARSACWGGRSIAEG